MTRFALSFILLAALGLPNAGCHDNARNQTQGQTVSPDGSTATQTRSQTRTMSSGAVVNETETRKREVVQPAPSGGSDQTMRDVTGK